jgi:hypothetical protein
VLSVARGLALAVHRVLRLTWRRWCLAHNGRCLPSRNGERNLMGTRRCRNA